MRGRRSPYSEEVSYRKDELIQPLRDQKTLLSIIQATYPDEYENFKERIGVLSCDDATILDEHWAELRVWTSDHTQSLSQLRPRHCYYGTALRFLARLEGYDEDYIEKLVHDKFEYLVSCQVYGRMLRAPVGSPTDKRLTTSTNSSLSIRSSECASCKMTRVHFLPVSSDAIERRRVCPFRVR